MEDGSGLDFGDLATFLNNTIKTIDENVTRAVGIVNQTLDANNGAENKENSEIDWARWFDDRKFAVVDLSQESFYYQSKVNACGAMSKSKMKRLRKDIAILSNSLPDGVFVRVDEERMDKMKVMIVGPRGTPYENGCFFFDLFLPADYPEVNPMMILLTTGQHAYRFNPNLYNEGKICLSLLGTWSGPGWDPETSTLLQLLVSIQALVFVDYPLENEPGYEGRAMEEESLSYNKGLHRGTALYAMLWHLTGEDPSTPACFQEIARAHMLVNKEAISSCITRWDNMDAAVTDYCGYFSWNYALQNREWSEIKSTLTSNMESIEQSSFTQKLKDSE